MDLIKKTNTITFAFAVGCLLCYFFFPLGDLRLEVFTVPIIFLMILPLLYNKFIIKRSIENVGFSSFHITRKDLFYLISGVVIGGIIGFFIISMQYGLDRYISGLTPVMFVHFGAFLIYELAFMSIVLFLFTFFAWGFVYMIPWKRSLYAYISALIFFMILLIDFYDGIMIVFPLLIPAIFVAFLSKRVNITYLFLAFFIIHLIMDTLIITSNAPIV
jgi:hypothetical protein